MNNLIATLIFVMLAGPAFAQQGSVDYSDPKPGSNAEQGTSDFDPVPGPCDEKGEVIRDECRDDPNYMRQWGVYEDNTTVYDEESDRAFTEDFVLPYHKKGVREFSGSAEFCQDINDVMADTTEFEGATCTVK